MDIRIVHAVQHQVHCSDPQHGRVKVEPVEHFATDMFSVIFKQIPGIDILNFTGVWIRLFNHTFW